MKKFDCFTFFNELDLLEFRLRLLNDTIDYFVIVESNLSFSGKEKPYFFRESANRFAAWRDKIVYHPIQQSTNGLVFKEKTTHDIDDGAWALEYEQRNAIKNAITASPDDLVFIGDLDEIPDPLIIQNIKAVSKPRSLSMLFHYYFMNCRNIGDEKTWNGTIVVSGSYFNAHTCQYIRDNRNNYISIADGGWHFSYLGGVEKIKYKLRSFAHTEYNKEEFLNDEHILLSLEKGNDILKRPKTKFRFYPIIFYPTRLKRVMHIYPHFIKKISLIKWLTSYLR